MNISLDSHQYINAFSGHTVALMVYDAEDNRRSVNDIYEMKQFQECSQH